MNPNAGLEPGLYFSLSDSIYHADPAISRSNIVALNDTPYTYWEQSWMNPDRERKKGSEAMDYGEAFHCQLFEPARFEKQYFVFPTESWDNNRRMISKENHDSIVDCIKVLRAGKDSARFLTGGMPEVTIVFDAFGMRFRIRIDYLTSWPNGSTAIVDFKTIYSLDEWAIKKHFQQFGYDVQLYLYKLGVTTFKEQFRAKTAYVFGPVDKAWFECFMRSDLNEFLFIFQRKTPPYPYEPLWADEMDEQSGLEKTMRALEVYNTNFKKFGTKPWEVSDGRVKRFSSQYGIIREN